MAASGSSDSPPHSMVEFDESEVGFPGMAEGWEKCISVRSRFRKHLPWLQFPIPSKKAGETPVETGDGQQNEAEPENPHLPSTRALELNWEILDSMLSIYTGEFIDIDRMTKEAGLTLVKHDAGKVSDLDFIHVHEFFFRSSDCSES